jgi:chromosome segregation ATPase
MSIQGKVTELQSIKGELKSLRERGTKLRTRIKEIEEEIDTYLEVKDQPGLKYKGLAITIDTKEKRKIKKKTDQINDAISVLEKHGVHNPKTVLDEIVEARRGSPTEHRKLKIQTYKPKKY